MKQIIKIGTRGSRLALYQANKVKDQLQSAIPELHIEIKIIHTKGDKILDVALSKIGDKGLFTKELEIAILNKDIDIAIHSLKDLPTNLPEGLKLGAVLERGEYRDAFVGCNGLTLKDITNKHTIATSSLRRQAGLLRQIPNLIIKDIRGNVETRLRKMEDGYCDGMVMAAAGLQRLGLENYISELIEPEIIIPAVSQGIIAIEMRRIDPVTETIISNINNPFAWIMGRTERAFLNTLQGGCQIPIGAYSKIENNIISLRGFVASPDGKEYLEDSLSGPIDQPLEIGQELAQRLIEKGAISILETVRS